MSREYVEIADSIIGGFTKMIRLLAVLCIIFVPLGAWKAIELLSLLIVKIFGS